MLKSLQDLQHLLHHLFCLIKCSLLLLFLAIVSMNFLFLTLCRFMKSIVIKVKKRKNMIYKTRLLHLLSAYFMLGYLFYYISCVPIVDTCHIVLLCSFLLLGYYKFYKGILLAFLRVILMFYYYSYLL